MWWNSRIVRFRTGHFVVYELTDTPRAFTLVTLAEFAEYMATVHHEELVHYQPASYDPRNVGVINAQALFRIMTPPIVSMFKATPAFDVATSDALVAMARPKPVACAFCGAVEPTAHSPDCKG